jgi:hypothetical protein
MTDPPNEKMEKAIARNMIVMVREINARSPTAAQRR